MSRTIYLDNSFSIAEELLSMQFEILLSNTYDTKSLILSIFSAWLTQIMVIYIYRLIINLPSYLYKKIKHKNRDNKLYLVKETNWYSYIFFMILVSMFFYYILVIEPINSYFIPISQEHYFYKVTTETAISFSVLAVVTFPIIRIIYTLIFNRHLEKMSLKKITLISIFSLLLILLYIFL